MISDFALARNTARPVRPNLYLWFGGLLGSVMPLVAAVLFPTYMHQMQPAWLEWVRLLELPFVGCELAVILAAAYGGHSDGAIVRKLPRDVIGALLLLAIGLTVGSVLFSKNVAASVLLSAGTVIHLRFGTAIYYFARQSGGRDADRLVWLLALGLVPLAALTWWRFSFAPAPETVLGGVIEWGSALPGFINVRHFGSWTGAIAAGLMIQLAYDEERPRPATDALYVFAFGLTCWSGTRAALVGMAAVAVITSVSLRRLPLPVRLLRLGGLTAAAYLLAIAFRFDNVDFLLFVPSDTAGADALSGGRLALWRATLESWSRSPLFGWGSGSTFWEVDIGWRHTQPHNVILQYLISWGLLGATGGLWLLGRLILATHRTGITDERLRPLISVHYCLIVMSLLEGMLYYPRFIMPIAATFAIVLAARGEKDRERRCQS